MFRLKAAAIGLLVLALSAPAAHADMFGGSTRALQGAMSQIAIGDAHTCAVTDDGAVRCWGQSAVGVGQLALGASDMIGDTPGEQPVVMNLGGTPAVAVSAGAGHTCALLDGGVVRCWGSNGGVLGQGSTLPIGDSPGENPVVLPLPAQAKAIMTGGSFTCALLVTAEVRCFGASTFGELAQGNNLTIGDGAGEEAVPVSLGVGRTAVSIAAGDRHACAILDDGSARCWGRNNHGQLGQGNTDPVGDTAGETTVPFPLAGRTARAFALGDSHTCVLLDDGSVRCAGRANSGQIGSGATDSIGDDAGETTVAVDLGGEQAVAIAAGASHTCAITTSGSMRCWGLANAGQMANGSPLSIGDGPGEPAIALAAPAGLTVTAVDGGGSASCAATSDRVLRCWGGGGFAQLGVGSTTNYGLLAGETFAAQVPALLGGRLIGRDQDGDGLWDVVDACPTVSAPGTADGCVVAPISAPTTTPEGTISSRRVRIDALLRLKRSATRCPARIDLSVRAGGRTVASRRVKPKTVKEAGVRRCRVRADLTLKKRPTGTVRVTLRGTGVVTRTITLVKI